MYKKYNIAILGFFTLILLTPFAGILFTVNYDLDLIFSFLTNDYIKRIIFFSLYQAFLSAFISCFFAIPFALALNRHKNLRLIKIIVSLCGFSFVIPSILIVYAVIKIFGNNGFLNLYFNIYDFLSIDSIYGLRAILIAHILLNTPFATRLFFQNLNNIPRKYYEISNSLNMSFLGNIMRLEYPIIKQNLLSVFAIIFSLCFLSFAIVMALGGGPKNSTLEVAIYQYALFELNFNKAIILSFVQIIICSFFVIIGFLKLKGLNFFEIDIKYNTHPHKDYTFIKLADLIIIIIFSIFLFSPLILLFIDFINIGNSKAIFNFHFIKAFTNSLIISVITGVLVSTFGLIVSCVIVINYKNFFLQQSLFLLSSMILIISPIIFSLGYFIVIQKFIHLAYFKFFLVIMINSIFLLPFAILILFNNIKNIYFSYKDFKESYCIDMIDYIKIIFPLIKKNFLYVLSLSTVITFGDFTIISFFRGDNFETLPSYLYKLIAIYKFDEASFVAGVILIVSMIIYFVIDNINYQDRPASKT